MKLLYIAGPIYDPDPSQVQANIDYACQVAAKYWQKGYSVICPHANTRTVEQYCESMTAECWLQGDFEQLKRCDAIVLIQGWEKSEGSKRELEVAVNKGLEVIVDKEESNSLENDSSDTQFKYPSSYGGVRNFSGFAKEVHKQVLYNKQKGIEDIIWEKTYEQIRTNKDKQRFQNISDYLFLQLREDKDHENILILISSIYEEVVRLYDRLNKQTQKSN